MKIKTKHNVYIYIYIISFDIYRNGFFSIFKKNRKVNSSMYVALEFTSDKVQYIQLDLTRSAKTIM